MDFGKTFELESKIDPSVVFTFRRLNVAQAAAMRLDVIIASAPHARAIEKMKADGGVPPDQVREYDAVATTAFLVPIGIKHTLKSVAAGDRKLKGEEWLADPDTTEDLAWEAYAAGQAASRLPAEELKKWLSRGISSPQEPANATSTDATIASATAPIADGTAIDTSLIS